MNSRTLAGPMVWLTFVIAALWVVLGLIGWMLFPGTVGLVFAAGGAVGAILTGWLGVSMLVRYGPFGMRVPGHGDVAWEDIASVEVVPTGIMTVPAVGVRKGRMLEEVQLGGLAWFGRGAALALAGRLADAAGKDEVVVRGKAGVPGRRAAG